VPHSRPLIAVIVVVRGLRWIRPLKDDRSDCLRRLRARDEGGLDGAVVVERIIARERVTQVHRAAEERLHGAVGEAGLTRILEVLQPVQEYRHLVLREGDGLSEHVPLHGLQAGRGGERALVMVEGEVGRKQAQDVLNIEAERVGDAGIPGQHLVELAQVRKSSIRSSLGDHHAEDSELADRRALVHEVQLHREAAAAEEVLRGVVKVGLEEVASQVADVGEPIQLEVKLDGVPVVDDDCVGVAVAQRDRGDDAGLDGVDVNIDGRLPLPGAAHLGKSAPVCRAVRSHRPVVRRRGGDGVEVEQSHVLCRRGWGGTSTTSSRSGGAKAEGRLPDNYGAAVQRLYWTIGLAFLPSIG